MKQNKDLKQLTKNAKFLAKNLGHSILKNVYELTPDQQRDFDKWKIEGHEYAFTVKTNANEQSFVSAKDLDTGKEIDLTDYDLKVL